MTPIKSRSSFCNVDTVMIDSCQEYVIYIYKYSTIKLLIGLLVKSVSFTKLRVNFTMGRVTAGLQKLSPNKYFL